MLFKTSLILENPENDKHLISKINNPSAQNFPKFAIFSVNISFLTNKNLIFGISVLFYTGKFFLKSL